MAARRLWSVRCFWKICIVLFSKYTLCGSSDRGESRYSFSLTTFDPQGRLGQVDRALRAAELGTPLVAALVRDESIILAAPQVLPSPFMVDDGTSRFVQISPEIILAHSGLSPDGRVLLAAAQRLAIEHEYTFDENIPIEILLQQLSLLYQEYTMKAAARPFGVTLVVGYVPNRSAIGEGDNSDEEEERTACFGRRTKALLCSIDPSGSVRDLGTSAVLHLDRGTSYTTELPPKSITQSDANRDLDQDQKDLVKSLKEAIDEMAIRKGRSVDDFGGDSMQTFLSASLTKHGHFQIHRHDEI